MQNRLHLDFKLKTNSERAEFVKNYVLTPQFKSFPPTPEELETMANYILWGIDPVTGLNSRQSKEVDLKTRYGTWDNQDQTSLDQLMVSETFNEASVHELGSTAVFKKPREVFDREKELSRAGALKDDLRALFMAIDKLDYQISYYELRHGRRTKPIREELLSRLNEAGIPLASLEEPTDHWGQYLYLKKKHELVELRREQYLLRDAYAPTFQAAVTPTPGLGNTKADFGVEIKVLPLGLRYKTDGATLVFKDFERLTPEGLTEEDLKKISETYWNARDLEAVRTKATSGAKPLRILDFRNGFQVQQIVAMIQEVEQWAEQADFDSNINYLIDTFWYYVRQAQLDDCMTEILKLKIKGEKNQKIAEIVNEKYNKSYTTNYISTIYCQRIIGKITEAADRHLTLIENIWYPEEWKRCTGCGHLLLKDSVNFTKKTRASDGFSSKCKVCEKLARQSKQGGL